jgi:hypothetical protein
MDDSHELQEGIRRERGKWMTKEERGKIGACQQGGDGDEGSPWRRTKIKCNTYYCLPTRLAS